MKKIQNGVALFFIFAVTLLSMVSIMGVWDVFSDDVITKSFQTLGLLSIISVVILVSGKFAKKGEEELVPEMPNPIFKQLRVVTIGILVVCAAFLALLGVLAIWDVADRDVLYKSLSSLGILAFTSFLVVITCLDREKILEGHTKMSGGTILLFLLLGWILFGSLF